MGESKIIRRGVAFDENLVPENIREGITIFNVTGTLVEFPPPLAISDLVAWFDATQITGLSNNDPVATWSDLSGNAHNATQGTSGKRPTYITSGVNNLPSVRFDGIDDHLAFTTSTLSQPITIISVLKWRNENYIYDGTTDTNRQAMITQPTFIRIFSGSSLDWNTTPSTNDQYFVNLHDGANSYIRQNGVQRASGSVGTNSFGGLRIGTRWNDQENGDFDLGEFIVYNKVLTTQELSNIETYIQNKWGI